MLRPEAMETSSWRLQPAGALCRRGKTGTRLNTTTNSSANKNWRCQLEDSPVSWFVGVTGGSRSWTDCIKTWCNQKKSTQLEFSPAETFTAQRQSICSEQPEIFNFRIPEWNYKLQALFFSSAECHRTLCNVSSSRTNGFAVEITSTSVWSINHRLHVVLYDRLRSVMLFTFQDKKKKITACFSLVMNKRPLPASLLSFCCKHCGDIWVYKIRVSISIV